MSQATKNDTLITLATAATLAEGIINRIAGNSVSNRIEGETITPAALQSIIAAKLKTRFATATGG